MLKRIVLAATVLAMLAAQAPAAETEAEVHYYAVMLMGEKVGYMEQRRSAEGDEVTSTTVMNMSIGRGDVVIDLASESTKVETADGKPLRFDSVQKFSGIAVKSTGVIDAEGMMTVTRDGAGGKQVQEVPYPKGALMDEGTRLLTLKKGWKPGTTYEYAEFDADTLLGLKVKVTVGEKKTFELLGRKVEAIQVDAQIETPAGGLIPGTMLVREDTVPYKVEALLGALKMEMLKCDKAFAMSKAKSTRDFLSSFFLTSPKPVPLGAGKVVLKVKPKAKDRQVTFPETDAQKVAMADDGTITLTVERPPMAKGQALPYAGDDKAALEALKPTRHVESDDKMIVGKAREIVGETDDAAEAARKLAGWVFVNLADKSLAVGYASASEVIRTLSGDCTEHSVLLAALCRAAGIPARTATGMLYVPEFMGRENIWGGHQWTQAHLGGKWVDLDATLPPPHYTAGRITQSVGLGSEADWFAIVQNFGLFDIVEVQATK